MMFMTPDIVDANINLYKGSCSSLQFIKKEKGSKLIYKNLRKNENYYIRINGKYIPSFSDAVLLRTDVIPPTPSEICTDEYNSCQLLANGNFSNYNTNDTTYMAFYYSLVENWVALPHPEKRSVSRSQLSYNTAEAFNVPSTAFLQIAPNPVQNHLTVHFIMPPKQILTALVISNLKGQVISVYKMNKAYGVEQLDLSQLPAGTYFLSMEQANNKLKTEKFIKL